MGSRTRVAAAACLVASGLVVGVPAAATALADPGSSAGEESGNRGAASPTDGGRANDSGGGVDSGDRDVRADGDDQTDPDVQTGPDDQNDPVAFDDPDGQDAADAPDVEAEADAGEAGPIDKEGSIDKEDEDAGPRPPCCADDDDCGHGGWPWPWPQPDPEEPVEDSTGSDGGYGGGAPMSPPVVRPPLGGAQPPEVVPPIQEPPDPDVLDVVPGVGIPAAGAPVNMPLIVPAPVAAGPAPVAGPAAAGAGAGGGVAGLPAAPRQATAAPPRARQPLPASAGSNVTMPAASYRVGYAEYLRTAGVSQIAALALPGLAGLLVLTGAGGLVGYRQAKAGHVVRPSGVARFMNQPGR
ncbi:hypothetical protein GR927_32350 [Mycolicibacterium sp. 3033]|nr:hypothetical protein [Mycolicibacterium aurantiacum]